MLLCAGYIFSVLFEWLCSILLPPPATPHAYDDFIGGVGTLFCLFACVPVGGTLGISGVDKFIFKTNNIFPWKITASFLMGICGSMLVYYCLFPILGSKTFGLFPQIEYVTFGYELFYMMSVFFSMVGYYTAGLIIMRKLQ